MFFFNKIKTKVTAETTRGANRTVHTANNAAQVGRVRIYRAEGNEGDA